MTLDQHQHWVFISVGSNIGDARLNCCRGIEALCADSPVRLLAQSSFYKTEPVDYRDQVWFINAAVKVQTALTPHELLKRLQGIEQACGRGPGGIRFGPRVLDMDIILFEGVVLNTPELIVPHPRMHKRRFVLQPICDIEPSVIHPGLGCDARSLLNKLPDTGQAMIRCSFGC